MFSEFMERVAVDLETGFVSINDSKFKAWNSKGHNFTIMKLDARLMKNKNRMDLSYNVQTAVDSETYLTMDYVAINRATDHRFMAR